MKKPWESLKGGPWFFCFLPLSGLLISQNAARHALGEILSG
jgi:hypothetical protein